MLLSSTSLQGNDVKNPEGENLGRIEDFMIDVNNGAIAYCVLSFGGVLGVFDKNDWPDMLDLDWRRTVDDYYHVA